jgi:hypothetical protein
MKISAIAILALSLSASPQEPTLEATLTWMHDFTVARDPIFGHGNYIASTMTRDQWIFDSHGCSSSITDKLDSWDSAGKDHTVFHEILVSKFLLQGLDPESIEITDGFPALPKVHGVFVSTNNDTKSVDSFSNGKANIKTNRVEIDFTSRSDADRFAKAFRHAIVLCGGKPSVF